jgi:hypothetical protein
MIVLAQLFQDLEAAVIQQEPAVTQIEQRGEEVTDHVAKANTELDGAVKKARAARRKKWWCLGIVGMSPTCHPYGHPLTHDSLNPDHHCCCRGGSCDRYQKLVLGGRKEMAIMGNRHRQRQLQSSIRKLRPAQDQGHEYLCGRVRYGKESCRMWTSGSAVQLHRILEPLAYREGIVSFVVWEK